MAVMLVCLLIVIIMPIIAKVPIAFVMHKQGGYDNRDPRVQQSQLTGFGARALAAHKNCFEALAYFAPALVTVLAVGAVDETSKWLAIIFVVSRFAYIMMYWADLDKLRSLFWIVGFGCSLALILRLLLAFG